LKNGNFNGLSPKKIPESKDFEREFSEKYRTDLDEDESDDDMDEDNPGGDGPGTKDQ